MGEVSDLSRGDQAKRCESLMGFCPSGVCAVTWNANGLLGKIDDLREFISRTKPDILLIQETRLAAADNITVPNYTLYSTPSRTYRRCRGTAIL
ncbi:hypothetical protein AVEN_52334-1, partial [Araneus ventricosus]